MFILIAIVILGGLGLIFAALLGLAADYFKVDEDPRVLEILPVLPGLNCGVCGSASCHNFAERVVAKEAPVSGCLVGGQATADKVAKIMGVEKFEVHKKVAAVHCGAKDSQRKKLADYTGVRTCAAAEFVKGAGRLCTYGCLGFGDCFNICPFDAIRMKEGLPYIDPEKCTACGKCIDTCPRQIISLRPFNNPVVVACSSHDTGAVTRKICAVGCIACKICEREAPGAFKVENYLSTMDYSKTGIDCSKAIEKCPTKCIVKS